MTVPMFLVATCSLSFGQGEGVVAAGAAATKYSFYNR